MIKKNTRKEANKNQFLIQLICQSHGGSNSRINIIRFFRCNIIDGDVWDYKFKSEVFMEVIVDTKSKS
jgi:hypothetical protein